MSITRLIRSDRTPVLTKGAAPVCYYRRHSWRRCRQSNDGSSTVPFAHGCSGLRFGRSCDGPASDLTPRFWIWDAGPASRRRSSARWPAPDVWTRSTSTRRWRRGQAAGCGATAGRRPRLWSRTPRGCRFGRACSTPSSKQASSTTCRTGGGRSGKSGGCSGPKDGSASRSPREDGCNRACAASFPTRPSRCSMQMNGARRSKTQASSSSALFAASRCGMCAE